MTEKMSLEDIERLATQLSVREQLEMVANISHRLSELVPSETDTEDEHQRYLRKVSAFLRLCDETAVESAGEVDSAEDIRKMRNERTCEL